VYVSDTPLPDDPEYFPDTLEDEIEARRMERAIVEYTSLDSGNVDKIAAKYGVGRNKLRQELKNRGLMRTRGRPKVR
jgi:DNA-binding NtrC family response regulator